VVEKIPKSTGSIDVFIYHAKTASTNLSNCRTKVWCYVYSTNSYNRISY